ncbi:MAG: hypothetical protein WC030_01435 [Candidatus Paceibacterota bacterium]
MNTYISSAFAVSLFSLVLSVGVSFPLPAVAAESAAPASLDETFFIQTALNIGDRKLNKMQTLEPIQATTTAGESTSNRTSRTVYSRVAHDGKLVRLGEVVEVDLGKTGQPASIIVTRNQRAARTAFFMRGANGDWTATSFAGREDRRITVPQAQGFDAANIRANAMLLSALGQIEKADVIGRKVNTFVTTSYTDANNFVVSPVGAFGDVMTWKSYVFINGVLN